MKQAFLLFGALMCLTTMACAQVTNTTKIHFIPSYANSTNITNGDFTPENSTITYVRIYGFVYDDTVNEYHIPNDIKNWLGTLNATELDEHQRELLANRTAPFMWGLISDVFVNVTFANNATETLTNETGLEGHFDEFLTVRDLNATDTVEFNGTAPNGTFSGFAVLPSAFGQAVVSDIDDVLRVTRVFDSSEGLQSTFLEEYDAVEGMPELFAQWEQTLSNASFHYVTTTPIQLAQPYYDWLLSSYPVGSLDMRPTDLSNIDDILQARSLALTKLIETFPDRQFSFLGHTGSINLLQAYPDLEQQFPDNVQCIFIRNLTATEPDFNATFALEDLELAFQDVPREKWFVYDNSSQLASIDLASGSCWPPGFFPDEPSSTGAITSGLVVSGAVELVVGVWLGLVCAVMVLFV